MMIGLLMIPMPKTFAPNPFHVRIRMAHHNMDIDSLSGFNFESSSYVITLIFLKFLWIECDQSDAREGIEEIAILWLEDSRKESKMKHFNFDNCIRFFRNAV